MTEASPVTHATSDVAGTAKPGSIGPLLPNTEARVVDVATGEDLPPGADGELLIRGPQVMRGYLNNPDATARTPLVTVTAHVSHKPRRPHSSVISTPKRFAASIR